jgi:hypothetical protein|tara:strand:- start:2066 stop:3238 length:1173 start_codon:yes stop_codon:yes gene_type:complete
MRYLILLLWCFVAQGQILKKAYDEFFKYSSIYVAGNVSNAYEKTTKDYFVEKPADGDLYGIPRVIDVTEYYPNDYRVGFGIRKLARFDYEVKPNFYDGTEINKALSAPTAAVKGFEYLFHYEQERERGEEFVNTRYFLRHTGKYHIIKLEQREQGNVGFEYQSAEARLRLPIGKKFSVSAGYIYRTHQTAYGYNPIEIWLNETDQDGLPVNPWYSLGYMYGFKDNIYISNIYDQDGNMSEVIDYVWVNERGQTVAYTDLDFRNRIFGRLMNRYNAEKWAELDSFAEYAPIVGFDFYHYGSKFWLHAYANYILPHHEYVKGNVDFSYLHRNSWGKGGHNNLLGGEQWEDWQGGLILGWKITKRLGIFIESEYTRFWDTEMHDTRFGLNLRL